MDTDHLSDLPHCTLKTLGDPDNIKEPTDIELGSHLCGCESANKSRRFPKQYTKRGTLKKMRGGAINT